MNCFRSLYLWVDLQRGDVIRQVAKGCELLSFFVPLGWFTATTSCGCWYYTLWIAFVLCTFGLIYSQPLVHARQIGLWIAFVLCTFGLIYSRRPGRPEGRQVVNCFRSLYLWVDLQPHFGVPPVVWSCELLSFFVPLGWFTAAEQRG